MPAQGPPAHTTQLNGRDVATAGDRLDDDQIEGLVGTLASPRDRARFQMRFNKVLPLVLLGLLALPVGGSTAASAQTLETGVKITSVQLSAQPMVYVTATISMAEIPAFMGAAFTTLDQFLGTSGVAALGPPMAVYHDWSGDKTAVDVGFPVSSADAAKAGDGVLAGMTPNIDSGAQCGRRDPRLEADQDALNIHLSAPYSADTLAAEDGLPLM